MSSRDAQRALRLSQEPSQRLSQRQLEAVHPEDGDPRRQSLHLGPSPEVVQEAELKLVASDQSSPGDEVFSAEARAIIDPRSISFRAVKDILKGVLSGDLVPDVELFEATRNLSKKITVGTTIKVIGENDDGSREGRVHYADEQVRFMPGEDAKVKERCDWATEDIAQYVVPELITDDKQIYLHHLDDADVGGEFQGAFVSQARSTRFRDLVAALEVHFGDRAESAFVWLDIFSANQPELTRRDGGTPDETKKAYEEYMTVGLHRAIAKFEELVVFFDRWDTPAPLQRAWCVWEVLGAVKNGRSLQIAITPGEEEGFEEQLLMDPDEIAKIMADNIDMRNAECHKAEDKKMIDDAVGKVDGNFTTLNMVVNGRVREWHLQMARQAVDKARQRGNEEGLADILRSAGALFHSQSVLNEALTYYEEALSIRKESLGDRHSSVAATLNNIALVYKAQGRYEEALAYYEEALSIRKESLGDRHPDVAQTLHNIADVYDSQGRYEEALAYYEEALSIRKESLGDRHPSVATTLNNIASVYDSQGRYEEALAYHEEALSIRKEILGDRHPSVATSLNSIASVYDSQGRYEEALAYHEEALSIRKESLGDWHPDVATTLNNIAGVYRAQGRHEEALAYYEEALSIRKEIFGDRHPSQYLRLVPSPEVVQEAELKLVPSDQSSPGDEVFSAEARAIIDPRSISFRAVEVILKGVLSGDLVPDVELFEATRDLSEEITVGTTIKVIGENDDGSREGRVHYANEQVTFMPGKDAKVKERCDWATEDIAQYVVPELITDDKQIYLHHLDNADVGVEFQGTFVSQARSTRYRDLVAALEAHFGDRAESAFVWLDIFSANQPELTRRDGGTPDETKKAYGEYMTDGLHRAIARFDELVVFFDRWDTPVPLQRAWCVWEVLGAVKNGRPLQIAISPGEEEGFEEQLLKDPSGIAKIMADNNDMRNAECHKAEDKKMIDDAVGKVDGNFTTLNMVVNGRVREWHLQMARQAVDKARQRENEKDLANILRGAGALFKSQSVLNEALAYYEEALSIYKESLDDRHPPVAATLNGIAFVYHLQGRYREALAYYEEALSIRKESLGDWHPDVAQTLNNIADVYDSQGRYEEALAYYEEALSIRKESLSERHPDVAQTLNNIANVYCSQGRYKEALVYYEEALSIRKESLSERHPDVAQTLNNIALVCGSQGHYNKALAYYEDALSIRKESLGERHPDVVTTRNNIANVYCSQGRYGEALEYYKEALSIRKESLRDRHPSVATTLNDIASVYRAQLRYEEALPYFQEALSIRKESLGDRHPDVAQTLHDIASVHSSQGRYGKALAFYEEALSIRKESLGDWHPSVAQTLNSMRIIRERMQASTK